MGIVTRKNGRNAVTLNANINYLKPATGKYLIAEAFIIKEGKTTCVLTSNIYNDQNEKIAILNATYYYI